MTPQDHVCGAATASGGSCTRRTREGLCAQHRQLSEPARPLGPAGRAVWERFAGMVDADRLLAACEAVDERVALRIAVLRGEVKGRAALRALDDRVSDTLDRLAREASWSHYARR